MDKSNTMKSVLSSRKLWVMCGLHICFQERVSYRF